MAQTPGTTNYAEIQEMEVQALQAIYMDDFTEEKLKTGAWNKKSERSFRLTLKPPSFPDTGLSTVLHIQLPNTYPKTAPICIADYNDRVPNETRDAIEAVLKMKTKSLLGQEMIYEIADCIQTTLGTTASRIANAANIPTLEEERAAHLAEAKQKEEEVIAERLVKQKSAEDDEERSLQRMVESVRAKQKKHQVKVSFSAEAPVSEGSFDTKMKMKNRAGIVKEFNSVSNKSIYRIGPVTSVYTATSAPLNPEGVSFSNELPGLDEDLGLPFLVLKECSVSTAIPSSNLNQSIEALEVDLRSLQYLQAHPGVCSLLAFRLEKNKATWTVRVLLPFYERGSLHDLIETMGSLDARHIRSFIIQLLEALDFLHRHRIVHGRLSTKNIMLERTETGSAIVKLSDVLFQHELHLLQDTSAKFSSASSAYWIAPEFANKDMKPTSTGDIWELGIVLLQMAFGLDVQQQFNSPLTLMESSNLSESFEDLLMLFFKADPKKRPGAFNMMTNEFLRNEKPIFDDEVNAPISRSNSLASLQRTPAEKRDSQQASAILSRYAADFVEQGRLGKGGFGEVVSARNKVDGTIYAIKKITQTSKTALSGVLSEVMLLSRLNNPFIVRYYAAWIEEQGVLRRSSSTTEDDFSSVDVTKESVSQPLVSKTKELDFVSSQDYAGFEFGYDTDEEEAIEVTDEEIESDEEDEEDDEDDEGDEDVEEEMESSDSPVAIALKRRRSSAINLKVTLYIQMEYCERQTLRDLIKDGLHTKTEECWRLFRQILEGLVYVHGHGVIHRDLKPENIFISIDQSNTVRIGDFGLARAGEASAKVKGKSSVNSRLTASIGTSIYVAPEVKSSGGGSYDEKADMYSLGIMLFEMSYPVKTGMERAKIIGDLREKDSMLPDDFEKSLNAEIILDLVKHKVTERPSSEELLRSGRIPSHVEDETIRSALRSLGDASSPYYPRFIQGLFAQGLSDASLDYAYDMDTGLKYTTQHQILESWLQDQIVSVFRRHGAVRVQRPKLIPHSPQYYGNGAVQLLNPSGNVVQLPYDLTLPFARMLAKSDVSKVARKSYTFGSVFRESQADGHPRMVGEVDFDIVSDNSLDLALREAEVIKVIDEIIDGIPSLAEANVLYHISHSDLLSAILSWCKVPDEKAASVKQTISKLNVGQWSWARIKSELRSSDLAIPSTCLEDLSRFNFRDSYMNAIQRLRAIFQDTEELESTFRHLEAVVTYLERFNIKREILINPLASFNDKFYHGNVLFQCIHRVTRKKKVLSEVVGAGGRYDRLIQDLRSGSKSVAKHAVGFNLAWKSILESMVLYQQSTETGKAFLKKMDESNSTLPANRRCDVLVDSVDPAMLRSRGISIVQELWAADIRAELVIDSDVREGRSHYQQGRDDNLMYDWIVLLKQDKTLKVRNMVTKEDTEIRGSDLVGQIRMEQRERERLEGSRKTPQLKRELSEVNERDADLSILMAQTRSKKVNRKNIVEDGKLFFHFDNYEIDQLSSTISYIRIVSSIS